MGQARDGAAITVLGGAGSDILDADLSLLGKLNLSVGIGSFNVGAISVSSVEEVRITSGAFGDQLNGGAESDIFNAGGGIDHVDHVDGGGGDDGI